MVFVAKVPPTVKVQFMKLPIDGILWRICDIFALWEELPQKPIGILAGPAFPWMKHPNFADVLAGMDCVADCRDADNTATMLQSDAADRLPCAYFDDVRGKEVDRLVAIPSL